MTALNGAIPFRKMAHLPVLVADNLYFDMARVFHEFFKVYAIVAKSSAGFLTGRIPCLLEFFVFPDDPHAAAAPTCGGFQYNGVADLFRYFNSFFYIGEKTIGAGTGGYYGFF